MFYDVFIYLKRFGQDFEKNKMAKFTTAANKTSRRNEMIQKLKNGQKFNIFLSQDFDLVNLLKCFENIFP